MKFIKNVTMALVVLVAAFALTWLVAVTERGLDPIALAGQQGDRVWTESDSTPKFPGTAVYASGVSIGAVAFPSDSNGQPTVVSYSIKGTESAATAYFLTSEAGYQTTLTEAFCGGTTVQVKVNGYGNYRSGVTPQRGDFFVIDNGAGKAFWGQISQVSAFGTASAEGGYWCTAGEQNSVSNFATPVANSGVTFPANSKVFLVREKARLPVGLATSTLDNNAGIVAAPRGSPLLVNLFSPGGTLGWVTVEYK